jgi:hypothetical protein
MTHPSLRTSNSADGLAQRILAMLKTGARPVQFYRSFAATDAVFERAIGRLFLKGQVKFTGKAKGRRLVRARA